MDIQALALEALLLEHHGTKQMEIDAAIVLALSEAISETRQIASREHIKATMRHERVGLFANRLRTALIYNLRDCPGIMPNQCKKLVEFLSDKRYWMDIGVLDMSSKSHWNLTVENAMTRWTGNRNDGQKILNADQFITWVDMANENALPTEDDGISIGFKELEAQLVGMRCLNRLADRIDGKATQIIYSLERLASEIEGEHAFV